MILRAGLGHLSASTIPNSARTPSALALRLLTREKLLGDNEDAAKVLDACPDHEWRLIFSLARFRGLRTPSETQKLRWCDVDWARGRLLIHSPKTEHHEGKETRWIPLFPELREHLDAAFDTPADGSDFVITRYRDGDQNLRTHMLRIIKRAGLKAWPKLFQNLRSTRETELAEIYPLHVVTAC